MSLDKTYLRTTKAEYIWLDGNKTQEIRSKTRILQLENNVENISYFPSGALTGLQPIKQRVMTQTVG